MRLTPSFCVLLAAWSALLPSCSGRGAVDAGVDAGGPTCEDIFGDRKTQVCLRWQCDRRDLREGVWSGDAANCTPFDLAVEARENALRLINLYRFLAGLHPVESELALDSAAQRCALMMEAARALEHQPDAGWPCYSPQGAQAAGNSNLFLSPAVAAVGAAMTEVGNPPALSARRWLLSTTLGPIGLGGTGTASCQWVSGGTQSSSARFVAWPPPGPVPLAALSATQVDVTGWSVHTGAAADSLVDATVAVTDNGADAPVERVPLTPNSGSRWALAFRPKGWTAQAGHVYVINVVAPAIASNPLVYSVEVIACP